MISRRRQLTVAIALLLQITAAHAADVTIAVSPQMLISPEQARGPSFLRDEQGLFVVVDYVQGFVLGRFMLPPGPEPTAGLPAGIPLERGETASAAEALAPKTQLPSHAGFPIKLDGPVAGNPCLADINRDGVTEIIIATLSGSVHTYGKDGRSLPGWPKEVDDEFYAPPSAGDLDADGLDEIVIGGASGSVYAWNQDGTAVMGWPIPFAALTGGSQATDSLAGFFGGAALADIDRDHAAEICIASSDGSVQLIEGDGRLMPGWPQRGSPAVVPPNPPGVYSSPAIGDLNSDGKLEIVVATNAYQVCAWRADGSALAGWPVEVPDRARAGYGGAVVTDLNNDGADEIVVASEHGFLGPATVAAFAADGALVENWPYTLRESAYAPPAAADLNGDGFTDIVVATIGGSAAAVALDGRTARPLPGWPVRLKNETIQAGPIIADVDGDSHPDIVLAALSTEVQSQTWIWALNTGGKELAGFPILVPEDEILRGAPAVGDLDGDRAAELVVATELRNMLYAWNLDATAGTAVDPWPMSAGGPARNARALAREEARQSPQYAPAAGPLATVRFELRADTDVQLAIFNIRGLRVRTLLDHCLPPGEYAIRWDGRDEGGRALPSGIYFYELVLDGKATTKQLLLLM